MDESVPVHPVTCLRGPFEESIVESMDPRSRHTRDTLDAATRRLQLLELDENSEEYSSRWRQQPGAKFHPLFKIIAQISFGVHLLQKKMAKSEKEVIRILQMHVKEVDGFLEDTTADFDLATKDVEERTKLLLMPLEHGRTFDKMLRDKAFRTAIIDGNDIIERIISRTTKSMNNALSDISKGVDATAELAKFLDRLGTSWTEGRQDMEGVYMAMLGNAEGWYRCFSNIKFKSNHLARLLMRLESIVNEVTKRAAIASRRVGQKQQEQLQRQRLSSKPSEPVASSRASSHSRTSRTSKASIKTRASTRDKPLPPDPVSSTVTATQLRRRPSKGRPIENEKNRPQSLQPAQHRPKSHHKPTHSLDDVDETGRFVPSALPAPLAIGRLQADSSRQGSESGASIASTHHSSLGDAPSSVAMSRTMSSENSTSPTSEASRPSFSSTPKTSPPSQEPSFPPSAQPNPPDERDQAEFPSSGPDTVQAPHFIHPFANDNAFPPSDDAVTQTIVLHDAPAESESEDQPASAATVKAPESYTDMPLQFAFATHDNLIEPEEKIPLDCVEEEPRSVGFTNPAALTSEQSLSPPAQESVPSLSSDSIAQVANSTILSPSSLATLSPPTGPTTPELLPIPARGSVHGKTKSAPHPQLAEVRPSNVAPSVRSAPIPTPSPLEKEEDEAFHHLEPQRSMPTLSRGQSFDVPLMISPGLALIQSPLDDAALTTDPVAPPLPQQTSPPSGLRPDWLSRLKSFDVPLAISPGLTTAKTPSQEFSEELGHLLDKERFHQDRSLSDTALDTTKASAADVEIKHVRPASIAAGSKLDVEDAVFEQSQTSQDQAISETEHSNPVPGDSPIDKVEAFEVEAASQQAIAFPAAENSPGIRNSACFTAPRPRRHVRESCMSTKNRRSVRDSTTSLSNRRSVRGSATSSGSRRSARDSVATQKPSPASDTSTDMLSLGHASMTSWLAMAEEDDEEALKTEAPSFTKALENLPDPDSLPRPRENVSGNRSNAASSLVSRFSRVYEASVHDSDRASTHVERPTSQDTAKQLPRMRSKDVLTQLNVIGKDSNAEAEALSPIRGSPVKEITFPTKLGENEEEEPETPRPTERIRDTILMRRSMSLDAVVTANAISAGPAQLPPKSSRILGESTDTLAKPSSKRKSAAKFMNSLPSPSKITNRIAAALIMTPVTPMSTPPPVTPERSRGLSISNRRPSFGANNLRKGSLTMMKDKFKKFGRSNATLAT